MQQVVLTGAGVRLVFNGATVGLATGISFSRSTNAKAFYEIDNPFAVEIAPTIYSVQGSLTGLRLRNTGGLDGPGIMDLSNPSKFFDFKYGTIEAVDRATGKVIYTFKKVVFDQDSWSISARAPITFSANFKAIFVKNETSTE